MAKLSATKMAALGQALATATTTAEKGKAMEDLICYLIEKTPGLFVAKRNAVNALGHEEIDVVGRHDVRKTGLDFLGFLFIVEAKNWDVPVDSATLTVFAKKVERRGCKCGILLTRNGITGDAATMTSAYAVLAENLPNRHILLLRSEPLLAITSTEQFTSLLIDSAVELVSHFR